MDYSMSECGGCSTCEIACSFKHTGEFNNRVSSIEIIELEDSPGYKVRLAHENNGERIQCDGCVDVEGEPYCVQFCPEKDELMQIIDNFISQCQKK